MLRAVLGALSWHAQQVAPHMSAAVGLLLSDVTVSAVDTIHRTNKLLQQAKLRKDHKLVIHAFPDDEPLGLFCWADAAGQNRRDGGSTQGIFVELDLKGCWMEKCAKLPLSLGMQVGLTGWPGHPVRLRLLRLLMVMMFYIIPG